MRAEAQRCTLLATMPEGQPRAPVPARANPYRPIAVGFVLLALPLWVAIGLAENTSGRVANAAAAAVMTLLGALLWWRRS